MIPVYAELAAAVDRGEVDFSNTKAFHLDEYFPTSPSETHSFVRFLHEHVFEPLRIPVENVNVFNGQAEDPNLEAKRYDELLNIGVAVALLGIGPGAHIGFNERNTSFDSRTHLADLSAETVYRDRVERGQNSPDQALTQGIATILEAELLLLVAYGETKGEYLHEALYGEISPEVPASAIRLVGEKVSIVIDESAASKLIDEE